MMRDPCPRPTCQGHLSPAVRYHADGTPPLSVRICWDCGWETPPLPCCNREPAPALPSDPRWSACETCGAAVYAPLGHRRLHPTRFCSLSCRGAVLVKRVVA